MTVDHFEQRMAGDSADRANSDSTGSTLTTPLEKLEIIDPDSGSIGGKEDESRFVHGYKLVLIVIATSSALVTVGLDATILATVVPHITNDFHTIADIGWYTSAYRLTSCAFQFVYGKVYTLYHFKKVFITAVLILQLGSLLCAVAPDSNTFIVGRAICGLAQAGIFSGCFTLVREIIPRHRRSIFGSIGAAAEGLSEICAPLLGGVLTDALGWRWCFWINLPIGAFTIVIVFLFMPNLAPRGEFASMKWKEKIAKLDVIGTAVFVPSISCLLLALQWAGTKYGWASWRIIMLFVFFVLLLVAFSWYQHIRQENAVLPPRILKQRTVLAGTFFIFFINSVLSIMTYYLPIYFQSVRGDSASKSGVMILPTILGFIIGSLSSGLLVPVIGYPPPFAIATSVLLPIATGILTTIKYNTKVASLIGMQIFFGFACGTGFQAPATAVQTILGSQDAAIAISVILFAQALGPAIFNSAAQNLFIGRLTHNLQDDVPGVDAKALENMGLSDIQAHLNTEDPTEDPIVLLRKILIAYDKSLTETFLLPTALASVLIIGAASMEWKNVKRKTA